MTRPSPRGHARRRRVRSRRGRTVALWAVRMAVVAIAFGVGVALGRALEDNPEPGGERTFVRTLKPLPVSPSPETVTVTARTR